jgi:molybdopterin-guanine dinucleotide biosynthesis protein A
MTVAGDEAFPLTLIVLAGGESRRMKRDKALLPVPERALLEHVLAGVDGLFVEVIVSVAPGRAYDFLTVPQIPDAAEGLGPLSGILAGLRAARFDPAFVLACDIPEVDRGFIAGIVAAAEGFDVAVPRTSAGLEPLLAVYRKSVVPRVERLLAEGKSSVLDLYPLCRTRVVDVGDPVWLRNINTPEEYGAFLATLAGREDRR